MVFEIDEEVEFLLHGEWVSGHIHGYVCNVLNNDYDEIMECLILSYGEEYIRPKNAIRKIKI